MVEWEFASEDKNDRIISHKSFNWGLSYGTLFRVGGITAGFIITKGDTIQNVVDVLRLTADNLLEGKNGTVISKATQELDKQRRKEQNEKVKRESGL